MNQGLKDGYVSTGIDSSFSEISLKFLNINLEESWLSDVNATVESIMTSTESASLTSGFFFLEIPVG